MTSNIRTGGQILADALLTHGVDTIFCVPGESYIATLDALFDVSERIRVVTCRQEGGAAYMAEAYGKLTGRPGICFVTRGPGATNASVGIHTARQDSSPVVLFVGQVARGMAEREAFQEIDFRRMMGELAKWTGQIDDPARIPEYVNRAFRTATSGRAGPVVLALPEDMQTERAEAEDGAAYEEVQASPSPEAMARLHAMLAEAERPVVLAGGSGWTERACADLRTFAEANDLPVAVGFRRQDLLDNRHPAYAGVVGLGVNPALAREIGDADLLLVAGAQLGEVITQGYSLLALPKPRQPLIHAHPGIDELGKVYQPELAINAGMPEFAAALAALEPVADPPWAERRAGLRAAYEAFAEPTDMPGALNLAQAVRHLEDALPEDAIIANGAGNFSQWLHRFHRYRGFRTQLAPQSGSMGYGVPAGVSAALLHPERQVVAWCGDGDFLMNGQEVATAAAQGLRNLTFLVVDNGTYGTIRMHQERHYPGRVIATDLANPDFAMLARAYGLYGETVTRTEDFADAFERAREADTPALLTLRIDPEAILPSATISGIRAGSG
ncbi:MAG: thiamine pyrophosphate-binding protein [Defluviicoccus sp.]|nr:thiamine pyrophosphate-binding protein [Defluviicoccus sp.]MDE0385493.1 thiamine pyrophosphate-binding protein [Defluviicoccus sp.]